MKQIVVISGKGGTGKTFLTSSFASISKNKVIADCDVDAADLHLMLSPKIREKHIFKSGKTAVLKDDLCIGCNRCIDVCRFDAITQAGKIVEIDPVSCDGCTICARICPTGAISMEEKVSGEWYISDTPYGTLVHARLYIAEENSGKLVSEIRKNASKIAEEEKSSYILIDGSPGIGCPVISSISGTDCAVVVTEPTVSGLHDAERIIKTAMHFGVYPCIVINKYDLNMKMTSKIESYCRNEDIPIVGKIPFDKEVVESIVRGVPIVEYSKGKIVDLLYGVWDNINNILNKKERKAKNAV